MTVDDGGVSDSGRMLAPRTAARRQRGVNHRRPGPRIGLERIASLSSRRQLGADGSSQVAPRRDWWKLWKLRELHSFAKFADRNAKCTK